MIPSSPRPCSSYLPSDVAKSVNSVSSSKYVCWHEGGGVFPLLLPSLTVVCLGINEAALDT